MINPSVQAFPISVISVLFFDQAPHWLRYKENKGILVTADGMPIGKRRDNKKNDRLYTLEDAHQIALALHRVGSLDDQGLLHCLERIDSMHKPVYRRKRQRG